MMDQFSKYFKAGTLIEKAESSSILTPLLWLICALGTMTVTVSCLKADPNICSFFEWLLGGTVIFTLGAYGYFSWRDPNRLQSEKYQLKRQEMLQASKEEGTLAVTRKTENLTRRKKIKPAEALLPDEGPEKRLPHNANVSNKSETHNG